LGGERLLSVLALDFDGTLVGCRDRQLAALRRALDGRPLPDLDAFWRAKTTGASTVDALIGLGVSEADALAVARRWVEVVEDADLLALDPPVADLEAALAAIANAGAEFAIVTARRDADAVRAQVDALGLRPAAGVHVVAPVTAARDKAVVLAELEAIGFAGDTESDASAAAIAGVPFAAVAGGQREEHWLAARVAGPVHPSVLHAVRALLTVEEP
jgi:phosphoglycolate phosphatase-like HAD superfamily hydrolase